MPICIWYLVTFNVLLALIIAIHHLAPIEKKGEPSLHLVLANEEKSLTLARSVAAPARNQLGTTREAHSASPHVRSTIANLQVPPNPPTSPVLSCPVQSRHTDNKHP
ncbi:hypothetical protein BJ166DRAFT_362894 [Pestalotiopsis sp. NC0098]|nr:hypothetical protein BJ166DRAFT_362894 [Pestalotiopsis sp. NC0098]